MGRKSAFEKYLESQNPCHFLDKYGNCTYGISGEVRSLFCLATRKANGQLHENEIQRGHRFHSLYRAAWCPVSEVGGNKLRDIYRTHLEVERLRKRRKEDAETLQNLTSE